MSSKTLTQQRRPLARPVRRRQGAGSPKQRGWHSSPVKRSVDVFVSVVLILGVLSWLTPLLFLFICTGSKGPLFFVQRRTGRGGKVFACYKFRTMRLQPAAADQTSTGDELRITRIGRLLRTTHLDELPQLLNVLLNQMSLVGPRPHMVRHDLLFADMLPRYNQRQQVKPGITGLSQAWGYHGAIPDYFSIAARTRLDLFYIGKASPALDFRIICRTVFTRSVHRLTKFRQHDQQH